MGWWSADILGGDEPLDVLSVLDDVIGLTAKDKQSYPPPRPEDYSRITLIRSHLEQAEYKIINHNWKRYERETFAMPIIAAIHMAVGAALPDEVRQRAITDSETEVRRCEKIGERAQTLRNLVNDLKAYKTGQIVDIGHRGLFQKMMEKEGPGLVNINPKD